MNDRYLFKAIDTNSVWRTGLLIALKGNRCAIEESDGSKWASDAKTLCQCTGLKDKNGKLIWENDIASYSDLITRDKKTICIKWNKIQASFVRKYRSPMGLQYLYLDEYIASRMEVIGNIFDNPELLESEE